MPQSNPLCAMLTGHRLLLCMLWLAPSLAPAAAPCAGDPLLMLTVTAGEAVVAKDRQLIVQVHDNGCVLLHRPAFYRDAGDYQLQLSAADISALRQQIDTLGSFDAAKLRFEVGVKQAGRRKDGSATALEIVDADRFELSWRIGGKSAHADWSGLHEYAEQFPDIEALGRLSRTSSQLQKLAQREDLQRRAGVQP